jgi:hypothetical protein
MDEKHRQNFDVNLDVAARAWMDSHPTGGSRVHSYAVKRCCGGGKICTVQVRERPAATT